MIINTKFEEIAFCLALIACIFLACNHINQAISPGTSIQEESASYTESTVKDEFKYELVGEYGIIQDEEFYFPLARKPAWEGTYRITHYGEPRFPITNNTARWIDGDGVTVAEGIAWAESLGLDGICAIYTTTPWYYRVRDAMPPIIEIEDHGRFLAIDRVGHGTDIDIYIKDSSDDLFAHHKFVREIYPGRTE